jgi:hypothetical protein
LAHPLEDYYDLTAQELLDAVNKRFRLKVALEGAVAEKLSRRWISVEKLREYAEDSELRFAIPEPPADAPADGSFQSKLL